MGLLHELTMATILVRIVAALLFAAIAGGLLTGFLRLFGDLGARDAGRLTAQPFAHVTLSGIFLAIAFRTSWIAPVPVAPVPGRDLRPLAAVICTMAAMLALVPLLDLLRPGLHAGLPMAVGYSALALIDVLQIVLVSSTVLGLLPLPGLPMGMAVAGIFPDLRRKWRKWTGYGLSLAAIMLVLGWFPDVMPLVQKLRLV